MPPSESSDALDLTARFASRARASVPPRPKNSLLSSSQNNAPDGEDSPSPAPDVTNLADLARAVEHLPKMGKRIAVTLEEGLRTQLLQLCDREGITPETFLEAAVSVLQDHPEVLTAVLADAQSRYQQRKDAGHLRRTLTSLQKMNR